MNDISERGQKHAEVNMDALFHRIACSLSIRGVTADETKAAIMLSLADATAQALVVSHARVDPGVVYGRPVVKWIRELLKVRLSDRDTFIEAGIKKNIVSMAANEKDTGMGVDIVTDRARDNAFFAFHMGLKDGESNEGAAASEPCGVITPSVANSSTVQCVCRSSVSLQRTTGGTSRMCELGMKSTCACQQPVLCVSCFFVTITSRIMARTAASVSSRGDFKCNGDCSCVCADCGEAFCIIGIGSSTSMRSNPLTLDVSGLRVVPYDIDIVDDDDDDDDDTGDDEVQDDVSDGASDTTSDSTSTQEGIPESSVGCGKEFLMSVMGQV